MKSRYPRLTISELSNWFGYTRQNYYKQIKQQRKCKTFEDKILSIVKTIRIRQPRIGTKKLYYLLNKKLDNRLIGRDALYNLLRENNLLIRRRKVYRAIMTNGNGESIYPDLRKGFRPIKINSLWCSDITYIALNTLDRYCYLIVITDEYSHLIVGYHIALDMKMEQLFKALNKALHKQLPKNKTTFEEPVIFHSDRGGQYKSPKFKEKLGSHNMLSSMCAAGKSHENPVAERLNGILKNELLAEDSFDSLELAKAAIDKAIKIYNEERPHLSCELLTPHEVHMAKDLPLKKLWSQRKSKAYKT